MARSIQSSPALPDGRVDHKFSQTRITIRGNRHRIEQAGFTADYPIAFAIGSGKVGHSFAVEISSRLYQSPASYYAQRNRWDMSPGYDQDRHPDFDREILPECLFCHTGSPARRDPITCERCHGPSEAHRRAPSIRNIVNPARLPAALRDNVCEQCHLSGDTRIVNPGKSLIAYTPGQPLEETVVAYVRSEEKFQVVSHAEQLARSRCKQASGDKLWCGSCHAVHGDPKAACSGCHQPHQASLTDCTGCHMPKRTTTDVHAAYTDHRIARRPDANPSPPAPLTSLRPWREPPPPYRTRDLGLALIAAGQKEQAVAPIQDGFRLLAGLATPDAEVLSALGGVLLQKQRPAEAVRLLEQAHARDPNARTAFSLAVALRAAGRDRDALRLLDRAIALDPGLEEAYTLAASLDPGRRRQLFEQYLRFNPRSITFRLALDRLR